MSEPRGATMDVPVMSAASLAARKRAWGLSTTAPLAAPHQLILAALGIALFAALFELVQHPIWAIPITPRPSAPTPEQAATTFLWLGLALTLFYALGAALPFRAYLLASRLLASRVVSARLIVGLTAALAAISCLIYPTGSDLFDYAGFERMWVVYGDNPLFGLPITRPYDWVTPLVWFPDRTPAYGPLWAILTWPIVRLAGDSPMALVLGYKLLSIAGFVACCWLIWQLVEPQRRQQSLVVFAWSPLVLLEVLGGVHNDILPTAAMLGGLWLVARRPHGRSRYSLAVVAAGALVKVTCLAVAPPLLLYVLRRNGWRSALAAVLLGLGLAVVCYLPFWQGPSTLASIWNQTNRMTWSPASLLSIAAGQLPGGPYDLAMRGALAVLFVLLGLLLLRKPRHELADVAAVSGWLVVASVLLLTGTVWAQYLVPALALAAVSTDERLRRVVFWLSVGALTALCIDLLAISFGREWLQSPSYQVLGSLVLLGPAAVALVAGRLRQYLV